jgi:catechol 2,3-dioxygenase-like lactoylglutathione lyase family enzyme
MNAENIKLTVPFLAVSNMEESLGFYVNGLGFSITHKWIPGNKIEWCALKREGAHLMLQERRKQSHDEWEKGKAGKGVSIFFICEDALAIYRELIAKGVIASEPFVGNNMWVTSLKDPDGYCIEFESDTDVPEETKYSEWYRL